MSTRVDLKKFLKRPSGTGKTFSWIQFQRLAPKDFEIISANLDYEAEAEKSISDKGFRWQ